MNNDYSIFKVLYVVAAPRLTRSSSTTSTTAAASLPSIGSYWCFSYYVRRIVRHGGDGLDGKQLPPVLIDRIQWRTQIGWSHLDLSFTYATVLTIVSRIYYDLYRTVSTDTLSICLYGQTDWNVIMQITVEVVSSCGKSMTDPMLLLLTSVVFDNGRKTSWQTRARRKQENMRTILPNQSLKFHYQNLSYIVLRNRYRNGDVGKGGSSCSSNWFGPHLLISQ